MIFTELLTTVITYFFFFELVVINLAALFCRPIPRAKLLISNNFSNFYVIYLYNTKWTVIVFYVGYVLSSLGSNLILSSNIARFSVKLVLDCIGFNWEAVSFVFQLLGMFQWIYFIYIPILRPV